MRILKNVQANEVNRRQDELSRRAESKLILHTLTSCDSARIKGGDGDKKNVQQDKEGLPVSSSHKSLAVPGSLSPSPSSSTSSLTIPTNQFASASAPLALPPSEVIPALRTLHHTQNAHDAERDLEDLRCSMRQAMRTGSDMAVVEMMQVPREEMPEAMKTLQRALERVVERGEESDGMGEKGFIGREGGMLCLFTRFVFTLLCAQLR